MTARRFWLIASIFIAANAVLIAVVVAALNFADATPVSTTPADGATNVSTRSALRLSFRQPIEIAAAVRDQVHLEPTTVGNVSVSGTDLLFTPSSPLTADTRYTLVIPPGIREQSGLTSRHELRVTFTTRAPRLVLLRGDGRAHSIWAVDPTDGAQQQLTDPADNVVVVAASPDGDELVYVTQSSLDQWDLRIVRPNESGSSSTILSNQSGSVARLSWSPNGDLLAAEVRENLGSTASPSRIFVVRTDGTQTALVYGRGTETGSMPVWSPDGNQLAFQDAMQGELVLFNFTGTMRTFRSDTVATASWAPDSRALVFADRVAEDAPQMVLKVAQVTDNGTNLSSITTGPDDGYPAWSPAGDSIAFTRRTGPTSQDVWVARSDGTEARALYTTANQLFIQPVWSPDGNQVAVTRVPFDTTWTVDLSGGARQLAEGRALAWIP